MRCRIAAVTAAACVFLVLAALPAGAQSGAGGNTRGGDGDRRISVTGGVVVAADESVGGPVVSVDGDARITGRVNGAVYVGRGDLVVTGQITGDALVLDGNAVVVGRVDGDLTVVNGKATVLAGANVRGNVTSRRTPSAAPGTVHGSVETLDFQTIFAGFTIVILALLWITVTLSVGVLGFLFVALFPGAADAVVVAGRRVGMSFLTGLGVGILGPILGIIIMTTVVGIPLGAAVLGSVAALGPLGYAASALVVGRIIVKGSKPGARVGAFFLGFGILQFAALVPGLGFLIAFVFATYGLGAVTLAGWRAGRGRVGAEAPSEVAAVPIGPSRAEPPTGAAAGAVTSTPRTASAATARARKPAKKSATTRKRGTAKKTAAKKRATTRKRATAKKTAAKKRATTRKRATAKKTAAKKHAAKSGRPAGMKSGAPNARDEETTNGSRDERREETSAEEEQEPSKAGASRQARIESPAPDGSSG